MILSVTTAVADWVSLYPTSAPPPVFCPPPSDCGSLLSFVKAYLASPVKDWTWSETLAFQSIKKLLPASCRCLEGPLISKVAKSFRRPPRALPRGYLRFCRAIVRRLFTRGWDTGLYERHCRTTVPPLSGAIGSRRSEGGSLGTCIDHASYLDVVFGHVSDIDLCHEYRAELTVVQSAGKPRPLTKQPPEALVLRPLHKSIYDRLSRFPWLLRGDARADALDSAGFLRTEGCVLTSGDYKSATDNLSLEVAEVILETILSTTSVVPDVVKTVALRSLRPLLFSLEHGLEFEATCGQQMGSFLSFPLLCLQNYLAFRFAEASYSSEHGVPEERRPVLLNGDDILFYSTPGFSERWMGLVGDLGLEVERTKTSTDVDRGTINSTLLRFRGEKLRVEWSFRFGMLSSSWHALSLSGAYRDLLAGCEGELRFRAAHLFFRRHIGALRSCQFTPYECGFRGSLAYRMVCRFALPLGDLSLVKVVPPMPRGHNVAPSSEEVTWVAGLSADEKSRCAEELAAWRFSLEWKEEKRRYLLFCLSVSFVRPVSAWWTDIVPSTCRSRPGVLRGAWRSVFRHCEKVESRDPVLNWLIPVLDDDRLPGYSVGADLVEVVLDGEKIEKPVVSAQPCWGIRPCDVRLT